MFFEPVAADVDRCGQAQQPVREIFARIDNQQPDAHTVSISEPPTGAGGDCSACDTSVPLDANFVGASRDGSKAFFLTNQSLLPSDGDEGGADLYEYDFDNPAGQKIVQVSDGGEGDATPGMGAEVQGVTAISADGSHVYFVARGVLASNAGAATEPFTDVHQHAAGGAENLYLYEQDAAYPGGRTVFIAQLTEADENLWGGEYHDNSAVAAQNVQTTPDGNSLVFLSETDLTPDDTSTNGREQLFEYDARAGSLARLSIGQKGFNDNGNDPPEGPGIATEGMTLSDDGSYVFFRLGWFDAAGA